MEIRLGTVADIPLIKKGLIDSWVEHAKSEPELLDEERMRESNIEGYYQEAFNHPDKSFVFVAEENGQFAGFIRGDIENLPNFFKYYDRTMILDDVYVYPEFRHKGIATELFKTIEETAREKGIKRLQGRVYAYNEGTQKLLESLGYHSPHATWDKVLS